MYTKEEFAAAEWLILGILTGLLGLGTVFIPMFNLFIPLFWAVPIGLLLVKYGLIQGILGLMVAGVVWYFSFGPVWAGILTAIIGVISLTAGNTLRRTSSLKQAAMLATLLSLMLNLGLFLGNYDYAQVSYNKTKAEVKEVLPQVFATYQKTMQDTGELPAMGQATFVRATMDLIQFAWEMLPGMLVAASIIMAFTNTLFLYRWLLRKGFIRGYPDFVTHWRLPWYSIWLAIFAILLFLLGDYWPKWRLLGMNALFVVAALSFLYGLVVVGFYWLRITVSTIMRIVILTMFVMYWPIMALIIIFFGVFDPILNFRRLGLPANKD